MDVLLFRALSLLGLAILVALAARRLRLPYTVGLVLAGAALAATRSHAGLALTHDLIFDVVLPPLLFEAALNLRWGELRRDLVPVVALSTIGVALCAAVVAGGLATLLGWPIESALVFGALITPPAPIAGIQPLQKIPEAPPPSASSSRPRVSSTTARPRSSSPSFSSGRPITRRALRTRSQSSQRFSSSPAAGWPRDSGSG